MGGNMSKIMPGIYVGSFGNASNEEQLEENNITHILAVHNMPEDAHKRHKKTRVHKRIFADDVNTECISKHFSNCNDFIHEARLSGGNCLIHCQVGISRSVTVTCAYIMTVTNLLFADTLNAVQGARPHASPNNGFRSQLMEFEKKALIEERRRLKEKYGPSRFLDADVVSLEANIERRLQPDRNEIPVSTFLRKVPNEDKSYDSELSNQP